MIIEEHQHWLNKGFRPRQGNEGFVFNANELYVLEVHQFPSPSGEWGICILSFGNQCLCGLNGWFAVQRENLIIFRLSLSPEVAKLRINTGCGAKHPISSFFCPYHRACSGNGYIYKYKEKLHWLPATRFSSHWALIGSVDRSVYKISFENKTMRKEPLLL